MTISPTTAILVALAVIGVAVVILTTIRKNKKTENDTGDLAYAYQLKKNITERKRQDTAFIESYEWEDDPLLPGEDEWKTKLCTVTQRTDRRKIIYTTFEEAYKMVQKYMDMCFEHFEGQNTGYWPFIVEPEDEEDGIDDVYRPSKCFHKHCEEYRRKKWMECNANKQHKEESNDH